jgi:hypothetical protein
MYLYFHWLSGYAHELDSYLVQTIHQTLDHHVQYLFCVIVNFTMNDNKLMILLSLLNQAF